MRVQRALLAAMLFSCLGCSHRGLGDTADLAMPADLAPPIDLIAADAAMACTPAGGPVRAQYVWNTLLVPQQRSDYAIDLNGDGRVDNQLGVIEEAMAGQGFDVQGQATQAVASGQSLTLVDEHADDLTSDDCAATDLMAAQAMTSPDFSGSGHFTPDGSTPGHFAGPIVTSRFTSEPSPATAEVGVTVHLMLPLLGAVTPIDVVGARVTYVRSASGSLMTGQLDGAVRKQDIDTKLVPNIAASLTAQIQANPSSTTSMQLLAIFDNGGKADPSCAAGTCKNPDGSCAVKGDQKIDTCELATSGLIQNLLAPDVQLFDAAGNYHPNPANTNKDCLSLGFAFGAVAATF